MGEEGGAVWLTGSDGRGGWKGMDDKGSDEMQKGRVRKDRKGRGRTIGAFS